MGGILFGRVHQRRPQGLQATVWMISLGRKCCDVRRNHCRTLQKTCSGLARLLSDMLKACMVLLEPSFVRTIVVSMCAVTLIGVVALFITIYWCSAGDVYFLVRTYNTYRCWRISYDK